MLGQYKNCKPSQIEEMEIWLGVADPYTDIHWHTRKYGALLKWSNRNSIWQNLLCHKTCYVKRRPYPCFPPKNMAFKWVQENIRAFGGDPGQVRHTRFWWNWYFWSWWCLVVLKIVTRMVLLQVILMDWWKLNSSVFLLALKSWHWWSSAMAALIF